MDQQQQPTVGRTVHFFPALDDGEAKSNGNRGPVAAIITRVWSTQVVNLTLFPDYAAPVPRTSVVLRSPEASTNCWDWPARV